MVKIPSFFHKWLKMHVIWLKVSTRGRRMCYNMYMLIHKNFKDCT